MSQPQDFAAVPAFCVCLVLLLSPAALLGQEPAPDRDPAPAGQSPEAEEDDPDAADGDRLPAVLEDRIEVRERHDDLVGIAASASEGVTGRLSLEARPIRRAGEIVETVPGLIATQHSGDGKANQYFVRGINLDHGTDFGMTVAGIPVNMPTHGHGQGYADLNFLIPELVERIRFRKGPSARAGDFSAAGSSEIELVGALTRGFAEVALGGDGYRRAVVGDSFDLGAGSLTAAVEAHANDGPWVRPNDYERLNGFLRYRRGDALRGLQLTAMTYDGSWLSSDQVPLRAIQSGRIDRFGLIDPGPRGETRRTSLSADLLRGGDDWTSTVTVWGLDYDFRLVGDFTYFLDHPERGDQVEQIDDRQAFGGRVVYQRSSDWLGRPVDWAVGLDARYDDIDNALYRTDELVRWDTVRADAVEQWTGGPFAEAEVRWNDWLRSVTGLRLAFYDAQVSSDLAANSDSRDDQLLAPSVALVLGPWAGTEIYVSSGYGYHSNDARGATIRVDPGSGEPVDRVDPLVRARTSEFGVRTSPLEGLQSTVTLFRLDLDSELIFVGDAGLTEAAGASRRVGIEWTNAWRVRPRWTLELDASWVDAEFVDEPEGLRHIPGALESVVSAGIVWRTGGWIASLRARYFSGYPLTEDGSVEAGASLGLSGRLSLELAGGWRLFAEGFNLLDRDDNDVEYFYASRLQGEPEGGVDDIHLHPAEGRTGRFGVAYRF